MLQRFAQLVEQPRILDRDDSLGGEVRQKLNLLIGKGPNLLAIDDNGAHHLTFLEQWHDDMSPRACGIDKRHDAGVSVEITLVLPKVVDVKDFFGLGDAVKRGTRQTASHRFAPEPFGIVGHAVHRHRSKVVSLSQEQIADLGFANARRVFQHRLEYRLKIAGRGTDNLEHVGGGGLLLEGIAQFSEQPGVLDGDHGLRREILNQLDLLVGERTYVLMINSDRADEFVFLQHWNPQCGSCSGIFS